MDKNNNPAYKSRKKKVIMILSAVFALILAAGVFLWIYNSNEWIIELSLKGEERITVEYGQPFDDPGAAAFCRGTVHDREKVPVDVTVSGEVDTGKPGKYTLTYRANTEGITKTVTRTVTVQDSVPPVITLVSDPESYTLPGREYEEEGYTATDNVDGDITSKVKKTAVNGNILYSVSDSSDNTATVTRTVVYKDPEAPEITLAGESYYRITEGDAFEEPGYSATDNVDGDITDKVSVEGEVDTENAGVYTINYSVSDEYGNEAAVARTVEVRVRIRPQPDYIVPGEKTIYLTFDDGPSRYTEELLDILGRYNVKATFFVINSDYAHIIEREAAEGHSVGVHSATHNYAEIYSGEEAFFNDYDTMASVIDSYAGSHSTLMRFPGGSSNTVSRRYNEGIMSRLVNAVTEKGLQYFDWNVSSGDAGATTSTEQVCQNVINGISGKDYAVVLQHDSHKFSIDAVEGIIEWGLSNGYVFAPLTPTSPTAHHGIAN